MEDLTMDDVTMDLENVDFSNFVSDMNIFADYTTGVAPSRTPTPTFDPAPAQLLPRAPSPITISYESDPVAAAQGPPQPSHQLVNPYEVDLMAASEINGLTTNVLPKGPPAPHMVGDGQHHQGVARPPVRSNHDGLHMGHNMLPPALPAPSNDAPLPKLGHHIPPPPTAAYRQDPFPGALNSPEEAAYFAAIRLPSVANARPLADDDSDFYDERVLVEGLKAANNIFYTAARAWEYEADIQEALMTRYYNLLRERGLARYGIVGELTEDPVRSAHEHLAGNQCRWERGMNPAAVQAVNRAPWPPGIEGKWRAMFRVFEFHLLGERAKWWVLRRAEHDRLASQGLWTDAQNIKSEVRIEGPAQMADMKDRAVYNTLLWMRLRTQMLRRDVEDAENNPPRDDLFGGCLEIGGGMEDPRLLFEPLSNAGHQGVVF